MNLPRVLNVVVLALLIGMSIVVYAGLPDTMPALALLVFAGAMFVGPIIERNPRLINIPDKDRLLNLSAEQRAPVVRLSGRFLEWVALSTTVVFSLIQAGIYETARGENGDLFIMSTFVIGPVVLIAASIFATQSSRLIDDAMSDTSSSGGRR